MDESISIHGKMYVYKYNLLVKVSHDFDATFMHISSGRDFRQSMICMQQTFSNSRKTIGFLAT